VGRFCTRMLLCLRMVVGLLSCATLSVDRGPVDRQANPLPDVKIIAVAPVMSIGTFEGLDGAELGETLAAELQLHSGFVVRPPRAVEQFALQRECRYELPRDARKLAGDMGVDAVAVAVITQYRPYEYPKVGMSLMMFFAQPHTLAPVDIDLLESSGVRLDLAQADIGAMAAVVKVIDASERQTRDDLDDFAARQGDTEERPLGRRAYLLIMRKYEKYVCYDMVQSLLKDIKTSIDKASEKRRQELEAQEKRGSSDKAREQPRVFKW